VHQGHDFQRRRQTLAATSFRLGTPGLLQQDGRACYRKQQRRYERYAQKPSLH